MLRYGVCIGLCVVACVVALAFHTQRVAAANYTVNASTDSGVGVGTTGDLRFVTFADLTANTIAGTYTVATTAPNVTTPASFTLTNTAGNPGSITATAGTPQSATVNTQSGTLLTALVKDGFNNPVPNATVTFTAPAPALSGVFGMNGIAPAPAFTANTKAGSYTVTAGVGMVMTTAPFALTNNPGAPATITADAAATSQNAHVGQPFAKPLAVTVSDQYGNPVAAGITVTYTAGTAPGGASATLSSGGTAMMNASDQASVMAKANSTAGGYSVTARISGITTPASFALTTTPGPPAHLTASAGMSQHTTVGTAFGSALQATVTDASNNPVSGVTVTFMATPAQGIATAAAFTANDTAGGYTVTATVSGVGTAAHFSLTNTAAALRSITFTIPASVGNPPSVKVGQTVAFRATGTYADGSTQNVTDQVQWTSSNAQVVMVDGQGNVKGESPGTATITASVDGVTQTVVVTIPAPTPVGIGVAPIPAARPRGGTRVPGAAPAPAPVPRASGGAAAPAAATSGPPPAPIPAGR